MLVMLITCRKSLVAFLLSVTVLLGFAGVASANPLAPGWTLDRDSSTLSFQSVKKSVVVEASTFTSFQGAIRPDGTASLTIQLDSVNTGIDLRNVRMRFLFFETFEHPEATISTLLDTAVLRELTEKRRIKQTLPFTLTLHGIEVPLEADLSITLINDDLVSIVTTRPIQVLLKPFGLEEGKSKLEEAAKVDILPWTTVTFDLLFARDGVAANQQVAAAAAAPTTATANETEGAFSREECVGRLEILSRTNSIQFASGSASLEASSVPLLGTLIDIAQRCPDISFVIEGHTDSQGGADANKALSDARAASVRDYLVSKGVNGTRLTSKGFGELQPIASNDTARGRARNRRIQFTPVP